MIKNITITIITLLLWFMEQLVVPGMSLWPAIGAVILLSLNAIVIGRMIMNNCGKPNPPDSFLLNLALGMPVIALMALLTNQWCLSHTLILPIIALPGAWYGMHTIIEAIKKRRRQDEKNILRKELIYYLLLELVLIALLAPALCPPVGWDELTYHLAVPVRWLADQNIMFYMDNPFSALPSECEILFTLLIANGGQLAPRLFCWLLLACTAHGLFELLRFWLRPFSAWCFCLAFIFSPIILLLFKETYAETLILFLLITLLLFIHKYSLHERGLAALAIAGVIAGGILAAKPTGIIVIFFVTVILPLQMRKEKTGFIFGSTITFLAACALTAAPFYLRTWLQTGLPFFPFGAQWVTHDQNLINTAIYHSAAAMEKYGERSIEAFFLNPFRLADDAALFGGNTGWQLILICAGMASGLFMLKKQQKTEYLWYPAGTFILYCSWFFTAQQARFFIPVFTLMLIGAAVMLPKSEKVGKYCGIALLVLSLISIPGIMTRHFYNCWKYQSGNISFNNYLYSLTGDGYLPAIDAIKTATPDDARILLMFDPRGLYIPRDYEICTPFFQAKYFTAGSSFKDLEAKLSPDKPNYILFCAPQKIPVRYPDYQTRIQPFIEQLQQAVKDGTVKAVWSNYGYTLIKL